MKRTNSKVNIVIDEYNSLISWLDHCWKFVMSSIMAVYINTRSTIPIKVRLLSSAICSEGVIMGAHTRTPFVTS
jgi:hypothetical protein